MAGFDAVFVGSGINSLAGAALLAKDGWRVCVLERNDWLGGAIKTVDGLTAPGFTHEVFSSWHPLWVGSPAYAELKPDLDRLGLEYLNTDLPTATAFPDGSSAHLSTDGAANVAELGEAWQRQFDQFMAAADIAFAVLGASSGRAGALARPQGLPPVRPARPRRVRRPLAALRARLATDTFDREQAHGLLAPWVLHTGLGPDQAVSGFMTQVIACALQLGGMPVPRGGGVKLVDGLAAIVREAGRRAPDRGGCRADHRLGRQRDRGPARRRRDDPGCPGRARLRDPDAAVRAAARRGRGAAARPRRRRAASATGAARCRSTSR